MKCYLSDSTRRFEPVDLRVKHPLRTPEFSMVKFYENVVEQEIVGFGSALTESSAYVYSKMSEANRKRFIEACFGLTGNKLSLCRTVIQSSDFGLGPRSYMKNKRDRELTSFSIDDDRRYEIPFIKDALSTNPSLEFLASPWSPPAWAKTTKSMVRGGHLRKKYAQTWAKMIAQYLLDYRAEGIEIKRLTVQNEPAAIQTWESCVFSAEQECKFLADHLKPALAEIGLTDVKVLIWDQNKERALDRAMVALGDEEYAAAFDGVGFHWYTGDHFEALRAVRKVIGPKRELIMTEGCEGFSHGNPDHQISQAEHYAHEYLGNLNAGANGIIDWNILLDTDGGPNHVGNFCDAPVEYDIPSGELRFRTPYYYIGHITRFVKPGARHVLVSRYTDDIETCGFVNPDGSRVLVVLNRRDWSRDFMLRAEEDLWPGKRVHEVSIPAHSIMTLVW